jgi:8-oxo-dGTP diphosphatase
MYTYRHPHPAVTVDVVLFSGEGPVREVLLIRRGAEPHKGDWALPGGFVDIDEGLEAAARRELLEETGLQAPALRQIGAGPPEHGLHIAWRTRIPKAEWSSR